MLRSNQIVFGVSLASLWRVVDCNPLGKVSRTAVAFSVELLVFGIRCVMYFLSGFPFFFFTLRYVVNAERVKLLNADRLNERRTDKSIPVHVHIPFKGLEILQSI